MGLRTKTGADIISVRWETVVVPNLLPNFSFKKSLLYGYEVLLRVTVMVVHIILLHQNTIMRNPYFGELLLTFVCYIGLMLWCEDGGSIGGTTVHLIVAVFLHYRPSSRKSDDELSAFYIVKGVSLGRTTLQFVARHTTGGPVASKPRQIQVGNVLKSWQRQLRYTFYWW